MGNEDQTLDDVVTFLREQDTFQIGEITLSTRIESDLGISGDDAPPFMEEFFRRFRVAPTGFSFDRYFLSEGIVIPLLTPLLYRVFNKKPMSPPPSYDLTVEDLVRSVRAGKWIDPI